MIFQQSHILTCIARLERDINNCVGQGYDGAASVSGHVSGVQTRIQEKASTEPRLTGCQQHRVSQVNVDETVSDYYKRSIWFPYLDGVISNMCDKFSGAAETVILLS